MLDALRPENPFRQRNWAFLEGALSPEECRRLTARFDAEPAQAGGLVTAGHTPDVRRSDLVWLADDAENGWIVMKMVEIAARLNRDAFRFDLDGLEEDLQIARYGADQQGFYGWHIDRGDKGVAAPRRKLSISVQLSPPDDYEGGDLEINADATPIVAPRAQGCAIAFPSYALHRVTPVRRGVRHSLVAWLHGPAYR